MKHSLPLFAIGACPSPSAAGFIGFWRVGKEANKPFFFLSQLESYVCYTLPDTLGGGVERVDLLIWEPSAPRFTPKAD